MEGWRTRRRTFREAVFVMRSLLFSLFGGETGADRGELVRGRPEVLRRKTIGANARVIIAASVLAMPAALYLLMSSALLPFVVTVVALAAGVITFALHRRGHFERAAFGQVYATLIIGLVLTLVDQQVVDFGLAVALLAPVQASLLSRSPNKKRTWVLLLAVVTIGSLGSLGLAAWPEPNRPEYAVVAIICFVMTALMVAYSASRLNSAFAVYERGQVNAYRHLVENVQDAVMRFSTDGSVLFTSKSAEKLFGCQRYELSGSGMIDRIHVLDRPAYMTAFAEANQDGQNRTNEVRMRKDYPDEPARIPQFIWIEVGLTPVIDVLVCVLWLV